MSKVSKRCVASVSFGGGSVSFHQCRWTASVQENGRWYCRLHAPSIVEAKRKAKNGKWEAEWKAEWAKRRHQDAINDARDAVVEAAKRLHAEFVNVFSGGVPLAMPVINAVDWLLKLEAKTPNAGMWRNDGPL